MIQKAAVFILLLRLPAWPPAPATCRCTIKLPSGFTISLYADNAPGVRSMV